MPFISQVSDYFVYLERGRKKTNFQNTQKVAEAHSILDKWKTTYPYRW